MTKKQKVLKPVVIALGGSIFAPDGRGVNFAYAKKLKKLFSFFLSKQKTSLLVVVGGGYLARFYQGLAKQNRCVRKVDLDWVGIHATYLNAEMFKIFLEQDSFSEILKEPSLKKAKFICESAPKIFIASGWKPGWSTDYVACFWSKLLRVKSVIVASNVPYIYDKDPNQFKNAKPLFRLSWDDYGKLNGKVQWQPGMKTPLDPPAVELSRKEGIEIRFLDGRDLKSFRAALLGKNFKGTIIKEN